MSRAHEKHPRDAQSQFTALWRDLERTIPSVKATDVAYERERKNVMLSLGVIRNPSHIKYNNPHEATQRPKHHGKFARGRADQNRQQALHVDNAEAARKARAFKEAMREADRVVALTKEMQKCLLNKEPIPHKLFRELAPLPADTHAPSMSTAGASSSSNLSPIRRTQPLSPISKELPATKTAKREPRVAVKTRTKNRWSLQERKLLNMLYLDIPRPQYQKKELWKIYYEVVSQRFQQFHPRRDLQDIAEKLEDMLLKRQMKEAGELDFWEKTADEDDKG